MIRRAIAVHQRHGARGLWHGALAWAGVYRRLELVELELTTPVLPAPTPDGLDFGFLDERDGESYETLAAPTGVEEALRRLRAGDRCFVARSRDALVSARWITAGRGFIAYLDRWLELHPEDVYLYETFTHPEHRGAGISAAAGTRLAHVLAGESVRRIVATVLWENTSGRRAYEKAGYRRVGRIGYVKLGPWRRDFLHVEAR